MKQHFCVLAIFGATGDLTRRKLLPALYFLEQEKYLKENFRVIAIARSGKSNEQYREWASDSIRRFSKRKINEEIIKKLVSRIHYMQLEFQNLNDYHKLRTLIENLSGEKCFNCERIFYLAVPSSFISITVNNIKKIRLAEKEHSEPYNRVMFEKPFGHDLKSARKLNKEIMKVFDEKQIYRIDHYM